MDPVSPWSLAALSPYAALGLGAGAYGTMIGAGGGSLIVPALLLLFHLPVQTVLGMSLWTVFANAASGTASYVRFRTIDYRSGILFAASVVPGAVLGALAAGHLPPRLFSLAFGLLLVGMSVLILRRPASPFVPLPVKIRTYEAYMRRELAVRRITDRDGRRYEYYVDTRLGTLISFLVGIASSLLGIGGGILHVPAMILMLGFPSHIAVATSHFVLAVSSITGAAIFTLQHHLAWHQTLALCLGAVIGAQLGACLSRRLSGPWITRLLAAGMIAVGVRMLWREMAGA